MIPLIRQKSKGKQCSGGRLLYLRCPWVPWATRWKLWVRITVPGLQEATVYQGRWRKKKANCLIFVCLFVFCFWHMSRILLNDILREVLHNKSKCLGQSSGFWGGQVSTHSAPLHQGTNSTLASPLSVVNRLEISLHAIHTEVSPSLNPLIHDRKLSFSTSTLHSYGTLKSRGVW